MASNTTRGTFLITRERHMASYDALPAPVREAVRNGFYDWACPPFAKALREKMPVEAMVRHVIEINMSEARKDARRDWGKQAPAYLEAQKVRRYRDFLDTPPRRAALTTRARRFTV